MDTINVAIGQVRYRTYINMGKHQIIADEPNESGGKDEGPNPMQLLLASLGACTAITLRMYADRKEWPLDGVEVNLSMEQEKEEGSLSTTIQRKIELKGELSEDQKVRLMKIADKCPVHKTITSSIEINSALV